MASRDEMIRKYAECADTFIFDIDGTLYHIVYMLLNLLVLCIKHPIVGMRFYIGRRNFRRKRWPDASFTSREVFLQRQGECAGKDAEYFDVHMYKYVNSRAVRLRPFKGLRETLEILKSMGKRIYVYSDFPVGNKLEELGVGGLFDGEFSAEDSGFLKPDKRGLDYLKTKIDFDVERTLFVGDRAFTDSKFAGNCSMMFAQIGKDWVWH
ncbi:MAG TPA: hypothetical protein DCO86_03000 [Spirochaetaceae bacterium]|nr:hypothetical protein [Spirochaetaceae bacterium]